MSNTEEDVSQEEIKSIATEIITNMPSLLTLEIFRKQQNNVHFVHQMDKTENIPELISFLNSDEEVENMEAFLSEKIRARDFIYQNTKFVFTRVGAITADYFSFLFVSSVPIQDSKRGLILIVDASGVVFFATCKQDQLNPFNLKLMSCLYPD
jgi:hypothetical protein